MARQNEDPGQEGTGVAGKDGGDGETFRRLAGFASGLRSEEDGSFRDGETNVEAESDEEGGGEEGESPAKSEELRGGKGVREDEEDAAGHQEADGCTELGEHAVEGAFAGGSVFNGQQHGAAPLTAQANALAEAAEGESERGEEAEGAVAGKAADEERGGAHGAESEDEGALAADAVSIVAEEGAADGAGDEGDAEGGQGGEDGGGAIACGEEEAREDEDGGSGVDVKVEELDGGADEGGEEYLAGGVDACRQNGKASGCCSVRAWGRALLDALGPERSTGHCLRLERHWYGGENRSGSSGQAGEIVGEGLKVEGADANDATARTIDIGDEEED